PDDRRLLRMNDDRLRIVEYHGERHAPTLLQGGEEGTTERLDLLIGGQLDVHPAGVLEPIAGEMELLRDAGKMANRDIAEVELSEFAGHPLEPHHDGSRDGTAEGAHRS